MLEMKIKIFRYIVYFKGCNCSILFLTICFKIISKNVKRDKDTSVKLEKDNPETNPRTLDGIIDLYAGVSDFYFYYAKNSKLVFANLIVLFRVY